MVSIVFVDTDGVAQEVEAAVGETVKDAAIANGVAGIEAQCGGACACATCHVIVDPAWWHAVSVVDDMESDMLEFALDRQPHSRLSCQIRVEAQLDGLIVRTPTAQS